MCGWNHGYLKMSQRMAISELLWKWSDHDMAHLLQPLQIVSVVLKKWYLPPDKKKALKMAYLRKVKKQRCLKISALGKLTLDPRRLTNKGAWPHPEALYLSAFSTMLILPVFSPRRSDVKLLLLCAIRIVLQSAACKWPNCQHHSAQCCFQVGQMRILHE